MERRSERTDAMISPTRSGTVVDPRMSLGMWLRAGRAQRGMTLEAVAKITKIQPRILERLEAGKLEGLPADVFVRGFVRSIAKCVGLDEDEALTRYSAAVGGQSASAVAARAFVEQMAELAPATASVAYRATPQVVEFATSTKSIPAVEPVIASVNEPVEAAAPVATAVDTQSFEIVIDDEPEAVTASPEPVTEIVTEIVTAPAEVVEAVAESDASSKKKRGRRGGKGRNKRKALATGTPSSPTPVIMQAVEPPPELIESAPATVADPIEASTQTTTEPSIETSTDTTETTETTTDASLDTTTTASSGTWTDSFLGDDEPSTPSDPWTPKMPTVVAPSVPWRRPLSRSMAAAAPVIPSLVIDDADPDSAERELEDRVASKEPGRRSFLPPILLDREDRSGRQGGLTLAVIILLIAATLTLSYLMRRPSSSGDGVTQAAPSALDIG